MASVILFRVASLLCGLAPNMTTADPVPCAAGFVAGPMIPLSQTLLLSSYPKAKAGLAMAMWSMTTLVAPVMVAAARRLDHRQHLVAVDLLHQTSPSAIVAAAITWTLYHKRESKTHKVPIDAHWAGAPGAVGGFDAAHARQGQGARTGFHSAEIVTMAVVAVVGFAFFLVWEADRQAPGGRPVAVQSARNFWSGAVATAIAYGLFFGNVVLLLPLWLQQWMGYTRHAGGDDHGARGHAGDLLLARGGPHGGQDRPAPLRDLLVPRVRAGAVDAFELQHAGRLRDDHHSDDHPGHRDGVLLHSRS